MYHQKNQLKTKLEVARVQQEHASKLLEDEKLEYQQEMQAAKDDWENRMRTAKEELEKQIINIKAERDKFYQIRLDAQEANHKQAMEAQQEKFDETIKKVTAELKTASEEILKQRQQEFAESSNLNIGQIVNPLKETIDKMKQAMSDNTLEQTKMSGELKANIENMMRLSEAAKMSTEELTRVFKHGSKVQGNWGETVLNELLESQGLTEGVHYELQPYIRDAQGGISRSDEGAMMRPDVILHLDQRREVIIDAKVSLTAFIDYVNAENDADREKYLKLHVDSIIKHVKELSNKDYSKYIQKPKVKMNYVIMFVPNTGALWTALKAQPDLWRRAMEKNVYIADEQTLFAALRIISLTWTQITQIQNHEQVYKLAQEMMDRVGFFMKRYEALGKALDNAKAAYEEGNKKLTPEGQSILQTCVKLKKLGAKQSDKNPLPQLVDIDDIPPLDEPEKGDQE
ncbi:MAG: DNA recombination protein RmuC [Bacteroidaceae bacterium]|nr:DNA recombination protein RmuC [Bacteroidaceae bacterium]